MHHRTGVVAALLCVLAGAGCAPSTGQIESAVEKELPRLVAPAASYQVSIEGRQGTRAAERVTAVGRRVRPEGAPVLQQVTATLVGVEVNAEGRRLERVRSAEVVADVRAADVAAFLERSPNLSNVSVELRAPDRAIIRTRVAIPELNLAPDTMVTVEGRLLGVGQQVSYVVGSVSAAGVTLTGAAANLISNAINPLVDLSSMPIVLRVAETSVQGDEIVLRAVGSYPAP